MFDSIDRRILLLEMHRAIEESATAVARHLMEFKSEISYPPNGGLLPDELAAIESLPRSPTLESALRKLIAEAAAYPVFHILSLADGVIDPLELDESGIQRSNCEMLHDEFYESYWAWRKRRPDPGWRLDCYEDVGLRAASHDTPTNGSIE